VVAPAARERPIDRIQTLTEAARGRRVIHVGFVGELMAAKQERGAWLHERLATVAGSLVGLDLDEAGVEAAQAQGYEAHAIDTQSTEAVRSLGLGRAEVVIAGELIEHLDAPGPFLRALHELADELVLTTPNAYRGANFLALSLGPRGGAPAPHVVAEPPDAAAPARHERLGGDAHRLLRQPGAPSAPRRVEAAGSNPARQRAALAPAADEQRAAVLERRDGRLGPERRPRNRRLSVGRPKKKAA
jgi:hypothetical protein